MSRQLFLKSLATLASGLILPEVANIQPSQTAWNTSQDFPLAGFMFYHSETLWPQFVIGQI
ncbi:MULTISPECIES: hypothetical protein [Nitrosomonas]|uniref:Uncharacterized protein n=1 Tax=Nitrosomonas communis TaxID=44574 RepID=A0A0F7KHA8_9PROT|nr:MULTISPECIES: hypothetical protein [Nitrosomonas]AKH38886.1 hypothetical protein AAW31_15520 [Nitrosomonas communis]TYP91895.1 hypothetical protein BCL69_100756 [Nitrosomonas communis]UVS61021.1 hypothetical protein NX761_16275 [Nitrosomonas sp. PLL12]SDW00118.1 hypothetical protein SAMN05421882_1001135 [Nitrosomonas communis]